MAKKWWENKKVKFFIQFPYIIIVWRSYEKVDFYEMCKFCQKCDFMKIPKFAKNQDFEKIVHFCWKLVKKSYKKY